MVIENVLLAFGEILTIKTLILMLVGVAGGLIAGAIPGFTIAMAVVRDNAPDSGARYGINPCCLGID